MKDFLSVFVPVLLIILFIGLLSSPLVYISHKAVEAEKRRLEPDWVMERGCPFHGSPSPAVKLDTSFGITETEYKCEKGCSFSYRYEDGKWGLEDAYRANPILVVE